MMERYSRQILFPTIGETEQQLLRKKHVLIVGWGALGTQSTEMLVRTGIGTLTIVDRDYIEWSNLQRQYLFTKTDAKERLPKAVAAKRHLEKINSDVTIHAQVMDVTAAEIASLVHGAGAILDQWD